MTATQTLYRVLVTTGTPQDRQRTGRTVSEVLYCGYDRFEAVRAYHASRALDHGGSNFTGPMRQTVGQRKTVTG